MDVHKQSNAPLTQIDSLPFFIGSLLNEWQSRKCIIFQICETRLFMTWIVKASDLNENSNSIQSIYEKSV